MFVFKTHVFKHFHFRDLTISPNNIFSSDWNFIVFLKEFCRGWWSQSREQWLVSFPKSQNFPKCHEWAENNSNKCFWILSNQCRPSIRRQRLIISSKNANKSLIFPLVRCSYLAFCARRRAAGTWGQRPRVASWRRYCVALWRAV